MKSYKIWNEVNAPNYASSKSWGTNEETSVRVRVGTSARNSHVLAETETTVEELENGDLIFRFWVDDTLLKKALLKKGTKELEPLAFIDLEKITFKK